MERQKKIKLEQALNFVDYVEAVSYLTLPSFLEIPEMLF